MGGGGGGRHFFLIQPATCHVWCNLRGDFSKEVSSGSRHFHHTPSYRNVHVLFLLSSDHSNATLGSLVKMISDVDEGTAFIRYLRVYLLHDNTKRPPLISPRSPLAKRRTENRKPNQKTRRAVPTWRKSGTSFTAPTTAARPASNRRTTKIAMTSLPNVAIGSLFNPQVVSASLRAVAELLSCCVLGLAAARQGVLCPVNVGALSKVNFGDYNNDLPYFVWHFIWLG